MTVCQEQQHGYISRGEYDIWASGLAEFAGFAGLTRALFIKGVLMINPQCLGTHRRKAKAIAPKHSERRQPNNYESSIMTKWPITALE
jgi:hypothetical protein